MDDSEKARSWATAQAIIALDSRRDRARITKIMEQLGDFTERDAMCVDAGYTVASAQHRALIIAAAEATKSSLAGYNHGDAGCMHCMARKSADSLDDLLAAMLQLRGAVPHLPGDHHR